MNRQTLKRLMVKGTVAYVAVFSLVLMVAIPAVAVVVAAANSVNSAAIINGQVKSKDLAKGAVRTKKIAKRAIKRGKIATNAVRTRHIKNGAVTAAKIRDGSITNVDISSGAAIDELKLRYSTKTRYLSVPGIAFDTKMDHERFDKHTKKGYIYAINLGAERVNFAAPVNLPDGAIVTNVRYNAYDNSDNYDSYVSLRRCNYATSDSEMAYVSTSGLPSSTSWRRLDENSISHNLIDNSQYRYFLELQLSGSAGPSMRAGGVIITYQVTGP